MKKTSVVVFVVFMLIGSMVYAQDLGKIAKSNFSAAKGEAAYNAGCYEEATNSLKEAIKIRPEHGRAHYYLALTYEKIGNRDNAVSLIESYLDYVSHSKAELTSMDSEYIVKSMELLGEIVPYNEIDKIESKEIKARLYNMHGSKYYYEKQYDKAMESFKKVIEVRPQDALAHFSLAICYDNINQKKDAINLLESYLVYIESNKLSLSFTDLNEYIPQIKGLLKDLKEMAK